MYSKYNANLGYTYKEVHNVLVEGPGVKVQQPVHIGPHLWVSGVQLGLGGTGATVLINQVAEYSTAVIIDIQCVTLVLSISLLHRLE